MKAESVTTRGCCFGLDLESDFSFSFPLPPATGANCVRVTRGEPVTARERRNETVLHRSSVALPNGEPRLTLSQSLHALHFRLGQDLELALGIEAIEYRARAPEVAWMVEPVLLTTGLSLFLERRGILALHASAVALAGGAVGFLAASTGGKSTLVASYVAAGFPLVTDDVLALDDGPLGPVVQPSYPLIKLTSESARLFGERSFPRLVESFPGTAKNAVVVGRGEIGHFAAEALPLRGLYLLDRRDEAVAPTTVPVPPREAVVALIRQSFAPRLVASLGLAPNRLDRLARWLGSVSVRRLVYPSGLQHLPAVHAAVAADLAGHRNIDL
ncbi:MAG: hypothetical protein SF066_17730 [Thermoanaerobaculia bacterium]|nr:hypothetical protein [Thermoanaerobaculia bacterium]